MKKQIYKPKSNSKIKIKYNKHWKCYFLITCLLLNIQFTPIVINNLYLNNSHQDLLKNIFGYGYIAYLVYGVLHLAYIADNGIGFYDE